jgi:hypothetical protein
MPMRFAPRGHGAPAPLPTLPYLVDRFLETGVRALAAKRQIGPQPGASLGAGI